MTNDAGAPPRAASELLLYTAPDGAVKVGVLLRDESAWLTQKALSELFAVFESGELAESAVVSILETTAADGERYQPRLEGRHVLLTLARPAQDTVRRT